MSGVWDLQVFVDMGLIDQAQLEAAIVSEFNPVRMGFQGRVEVTTRDVLNCGVLPATLIGAVKQRFLAAGGCCPSQTLFLRCWA